MPWSLVLTMVYNQPIIDIMCGFKNHVKIFKIFENYFLFYFCMNLIFIIYINIMNIFFTLRSKIIGNKYK